MHDHMFGGPMFGHRARRGDMAPIILMLLFDAPMHGYEIISKLDERSHGMWRPSAGSIYPNLQLLEEQEMVKHEDIDGKKVYTLTDKGLQTAKEAKSHLEGRLKDFGGEAENLRTVRSLLFKIKHHLHEIGEQSDETKREQAMDILEEAETKLNKLTESK